MDIIFEYNNISASERLESFTEKKLEALYSKYSFITRASVFFKKENISGDANQSCGIRLSVPGPQLYASSIESSFETAIAHTINELKVQLEKKKQTFNSHTLS